MKYVSMNGKVVEHKEINTKFTPEDIVDYQEIEKVVKTGESDTDFVIVKEIVEVSRVNRQAYIDSFSSDVGMDAILRKVALTGETKIYQASGSFDAYDMPENLGDALLVGDKAKTAYQQNEIVKGMGSQEEVSKMDDKAIQKYIDKLVAEKLKVTKTEEVK